MRVGLGDRVKVAVGLADGVAVGGWAGRVGVTVGDSGGAAQPANRVIPISIPATFLRKPSFMLGAGIGRDILRHIGAQ